MCLHFFVRFFHCFYIQSKKNYDAFTEMAVSNPYILLPFSSLAYLDTV